LSPLRARALPLPLPVPLLVPLLVQMLVQMLVIAPGTAQAAAFLRGQLQEEFLVVFGGG
jgi:hypothetical protein